MSTTEDERPPSPRPTPASTPPGAPTPVRDLMRSEDEAHAEQRIVRPTREFECEGERWTAELSGHTRSGTPPDSGAPLMLVRFRPTGSEGLGDQQAWAVGRGLDDLSDVQLAELKARARPLPSSSDPAPRAPSARSRSSRRPPPG
jgi:hypothetical protein